MMGVGVGLLYTYSVIFLAWFSGFGERGYLMVEGIRSCTGPGCLLYSLAYFWVYVCICVCVCKVVMFLVGLNNKNWQPW